MLHLQRASAGSGKTFLLAKTFIRNFIAYKGESGKYVLRENIGDSHGQILAITFTNKATNEMKQRIVTKLADLAGITGKPAEKTDYLKEFVKEFGVDEQRIRLQSMRALKMLLHSYSLFQVSTIDSFFQLILRTFANDTDLNDNYQVELNDTYVAQMGVDSILYAVKDDKSENNKKISYWIEKIIEEKLRKGKNWNPFNRNIDARGTVYSELISFTKILYKESFKDIQLELSDYFEKNIDIFNLIEVLQKYGELQVAPFRTTSIEAARKIVQVLDSNGEALDCCYNGFGGLLRNILESGDTKEISSSLEGQNTRKFMNGKIPLFTKTRDKKGVLSNKMPELPTLALEMIIAAEEWTKRDKLRSINISKLHYLGILKEVLGYIKDFRDENNVILLSDTNQLLKRIINKDDAPFIYERIGSYINHYLIDEFQDTSQLQWDNLRPLLMESVSNNHDNLIIGDVKQSIYRFRNAEPDLIDRKVPSDASLDVHLFGTTSAENMNWRSAKEIVEFNNAFFKSFVEHLDIIKPSERRLSDMYGNVQQDIRHQDKKGYVEVNITEGICYERMGPLVTELLSRGYEQKDIVLLVNVNSEADELVKHLLEYNKTCPPEKQINFISEESLCISESHAVKIIISILHSIANGMCGDEDDSEKKQSADFTNFSRLYHYYMSKNPNLKPIDTINAFIDGDFEEIRVDEFLKNMQTVALPALVESIANTFAAEFLDGDACYIAAFQDMVIDYCEKYPSDITSFLKWWNNVGVNVSISSPEGTNAVAIMTIHKSKGLEYDCVIMPTCMWGFNPSSRFVETLWVKPCLGNLPDDFNHEIIPPYIPIEATSALDGSPYESHYKEYLDKVKVDMLNKTYVAFTRAKKELYVFAPLAKKIDTQKGITKCDRMGYYINEVICNGYGFGLSGVLCEMNGNSVLISYGSKVNKEKENKTKSEENIKNIKNYNINSSLGLLTYKSDKDDSIYDEDDDPDPRSEGNVLHYIMSKIKLPADLHNAVLTAMVKGLINKTQADKYENLLKFMLEKTEMRQWFDPSLKVVNERPILSGKERVNYRPDRIVVTPDKEVVVIDYKFGVVKTSKYSDQIANYINLLKEVDDFRGLNIKSCLCFLSNPKEPEIIYL